MTQATAPAGNTRWTLQVTWRSGAVSHYPANTEPEAVALQAVLADHPAVGSARRFAAHGPVAATRPGRHHRPRHAAGRNEARWHRLPAATPAGRRRRSDEAPHQPATGPLAEVRAAADELFRRVDELRGTGWPHADFEQRADRAARRARAALAAQPDLPLKDLLATVQPVLDEWWPGDPAGTDAVRDAADRLRAVVAAARYGTGARHRRDG